jgi:hypothetical protein
MIAIHEIAARDIRVGDLVSEHGASGLDHWYDTADAGTAYVVLAVASGEDVDYGETVEVTLSDHEMSIYVLPDIRVWVIREEITTATGRRLHMTADGWAETATGRVLSFDEAESLGLDGTLINR